MLKIDFKMYYNSGNSNIYLLFIIIAYRLLVHNDLSSDYSENSMMLLDSFPIHQ